uniref:Uncharacterized protein n=1 Tax=Zea mays TaxID=4577 RepID=C0HFB3_MAIZE|nr:unknown [Zea mays]
MSPPTPPQRTCGDSHLARMYSGFRHGGKWSPFFLRLCRAASATTATICPSRSGVPTNSGGSAWSAARYALVDRASSNCDRKSTSTISLTSSSSCSFPFPTTASMYSCSPAHTDSAVSTGHRPGHAVDRTTAPPRTCWVGGGLLPPRRAHGGVVAQRPEAVGHRAPALRLALAALAALVGEPRRVRQEIPLRDARALHQALSTHHSYHFDPCGFGVRV